MDRSTAEAFVDALAARRGIVAVVGAGGKKSTLGRLIEAHRALGTMRIALTATVRTAGAPAASRMQPIIGSADFVLSAVRADRGTKASLLIAAPSSTRDRLSGLPPALIQRLHREGGFDVTLVKADGARMRMIKAPNDDEPVLPDGTTTVLPVVSAKVFGRTLSSRIAHRPERLSTVIDDVIGAEVTPHHVARLLASENGALQHVGHAHVVPIINMIDQPDRLEPARQAAEAALSATDRFDRIILASMTAASPLIEIVHRSRRFSGSG